MTRARGYANVNLCGTHGAPSSFSRQSSAGAALHGPPVGVGKGTREKKVSNGL